VRRGETGAYTRAMDAHAPNAPPAILPVLGEYLRLVAAGDRDAFERLYRLTSPRLFAVIRRMVAQRQSAEDVLQETFVTIWRKAAHFDSAAGNAMAWMTTIARHRAIDWLRRPSGAVPASTEGALDARATDVEQLIWISECLDRLVPPQRQAIQLAYYRGMSHEEIGRALDIPIGTVKSRIRRGLLAIKDLIDQ